jgi:hypothetical protein
MAVIHTKAILPDEMVQAWLQHLRDFDTAHPGSHFEVTAESEGKTVGDLMRSVDIHPPLEWQFTARRKDG